MQLTICRCFKKSQEGGVNIEAIANDKILGLLEEMENLEHKVPNLASFFSEIIKDEIDANDQQKLYNGIKRIIKKYSQEKRGIEALNEFVSVLCGGATLYELLQITIDEAKINYEGKIQFNRV